MVCMSEAKVYKAKAVGCQQTYSRTIRLNKCLSCVVELNSPQPVPTQPVHAHPERGHR